MKATVNCFGETFNLSIKEGRYKDNNNVALQAYSDDGSPFGTITVNTDVYMGTHFVLVKTYSENAEWVPQLLSQLPNNFRNTGNKIPVGYTEAEIWEYFPESENN
jgi:hypothetical protein